MISLKIKLITNIIINFQYELVIKLKLIMTQLLISTTIYNE